MENGQNLIFSKNKKDSRFSSDVKAVLMLTFGLIVVSIIMVFILDKFSIKTPQSFTKKVDYTQYKSYAIKENQYPQGFPMEAVVKNGGVWQRAEDTTISETGERQLVVDLVYPFSESEMLGVYNTLLTSKGWVMNYKKDSFYIYEKDGATLTLTIIRLEKDTLVDLKYVDKINK